MAPAALETMCHLTASLGSTGAPRPVARMRASRFCASGAPRRAALRSSCASRSLRPWRCRCRYAARSHIRPAHRDDRRALRRQATASPGPGPSARRGLPCRARRAHIALPGCRHWRPTEQLGAASEILRKPDALEIEQAEIIGGCGVAKLGGGGEQARGLVGIFRTAAAGNAEHGEAEHGFAVAALGGDLVPFGGLHIVLARCHSRCRRAPRAASWRPDRCAPPRAWSQPRKR